MVSAQKWIDWQGLMLLKTVAGSMGQTHSYWIILHQAINTAWGELLVSVRSIKDLYDIDGEL